MTDLMPDSIGLAAVSARTPRRYIGRESDSPRPCDRPRGRRRGFPEALRSVLAPITAAPPRRCGEIRRTPRGVSRQARPRASRSMRSLRRGRARNAPAPPRRIHPRTTADRASRSATAAGRVAGTWDSRRRSARPRAETSPPVHCTARAARPAPVPAAPQRYDRSRFTEG